MNCLCLRDVKHQTNKTIFAIGVYVDVNNILQCHAGSVVCLLLLIYSLDLQSEFSLLWLRNEKKTITYYNITKANFYVWHFYRKILQCLGLVSAYFQMSRSRSVRVRAQNMGVFVVYEGLTNRRPRARIGLCGSYSICRHRGLVGN